jgi:hypothetical protein
MSPDRGIAIAGGALAFALIDLRVEMKVAGSGHFPCGDPPANQLHSALARFGNSPRS